MEMKSDLVKTTDKSIQLKTSDKLKFKWTFTASIQLMLKKEPVEECTIDALLCEDTAASHNEMIKELDDLSQEGVEIVPVLGSNDVNDVWKGVTDLKPTSTIEKNDYVSMFYLNHEITYVSTPTGSFDDN